MRKRCADGDTLLLAARELARPRVSRSPSPTASSSSRARASASGRPRAEVGARRRPRSTCRRRARRRSAGRRSRSSRRDSGRARATRAAGDRRRRPATSPGGRTVDAREDPEQTRLARPARAEHREQLALRDVERQSLQRRSVALGRRVDAEDVPQLDRVHASASAGLPASDSRNAERVATQTTAQPSSASTSTPSAARDESNVGLSGGTGGVADAETATTSTTIATSSETREHAAGEAERADDDLPRADEPAEQRRRCTLRLEVEERVAVVAQIGDRRQRDGEERKEERSAGGDGEHRERAARDRVVAERGLPLDARVEHERVERRTAKRRAGRALGAHRRRVRPHLGREPPARLREVERRLERAPVDDGEVAARRREAVGHLTTRRAITRPPTCSPSRPDRSASACERRRDDRGQRLPVERLAGPEPRLDGVRQRHGEPPAAVARPADAEPAA